MFDCDDQCVVEIRNWYIDIEASRAIVLPERCDSWIVLIDLGARSWIRVINCFMPIFYVELYEN